MYNNYPSDGTKKICTVTAVDLTRAVCKCISDLGEVLTDVRWLIPTGGTDGGNSSYHPVENSKVFVDISSGFPFILGSLLNEGTTDVRRPNIGRQDTDEPQIADYTTISVGDLIRGPGTPRDQRPGDILNTSDGGALQGVLSSGTVINKASPLAQIICSRYGDLVRVVARNYERFSDVDEEYKVSVRGRVFSLMNTYRTPTESRNEVPSFTRLEGDVLAAELVGKNYASYKADDFPEVPEDDGIVVKEYTSKEGVVTSTLTEDIEGNVHREIIGEDAQLGGVGSSEQDDGSRQLSKSVLSGDTSTWHMNEDEFFWDSGDGVQITGRSQYGIIMKARDGVLVELKNNGDLNITAAKANVNISDSSVVNCPTTTWTGDVDFIGDVTVDGDQKISGNLGVTTSVTTPAFNLGPSPFTSGGPSTPGGSMTISEGSTVSWSGAGTMDMGSLADISYGTFTVGTHTHTEQGDGSDVSPPK